MNVVKRNNPQKTQSKNKNELIRKDVISDRIRGTTCLLPNFSANPNATRSLNDGPRYKFNQEKTTKSDKQTMGPPLLGPPRSAKRRLVYSSSTKPESSSSGKGPIRILAGDSAVPNTSQELCTPRNRPTALRYISSSSRGGAHSGTRSARSTSTSVVDASVILAISEGRGMARGEIGMAAIDLRQPHLVLCQFSDTLLYTHTMTKINYFNPVEVIVPHTFCEGVKPNQLYQLIKDQYPLLNLTTVQRRHFNDASGRQQIQTLCAPQYSAVYLQVLHKFYALTSAAAVLKYVEYIQCIVFARESLKIEYHSSENTMIIDVGTATQLELVQPLVPSAGPSCCLLGVLGPMYTIGGIRALRAAILQPSCKKDFIENRLDAVQDLIDNESGLMTSLQDVIKKLSEIDRILLLCVETLNQNMDKFGEAQLNQTLLLKTTMDLVPNLVEALNGAESGRLKKIKMAFSHHLWWKVTMQPTMEHACLGTAYSLYFQEFENPQYSQIAERIRSIIQEDAHLERGAMGCLQRCFAVKPNINGLLDVARRTYSELIEDIQKMVEQFSETYDLPLRLNQNSTKGFHIFMPVTPKNRRSFNIEDLPPVFIQVHYSGASVSMTTEELVVIDQQAKESLNEIQKMSNIVISGLLKELRPFMSSLYKLCENVAELDILLAFAQASSVGSYIRPEFSSYLEIRNSVHPLLDYNSQVMPVPNDVFASPEQNFTLITGPNMGGKSIYIKQIAVLQIMAQLGCFVPATNAVLRLSDRVFSRIGFNDSVELNASTYVFEMKEMQHILQGLTKSSLVIIDELCRGTCAEEGTSVAWAICEELLMSDAFTFFTTHFMYLTRLQDLYFNVTNRHTTVAEEDTATQNSQKRLVYQHKIELGVTKIENYGLALAAKTNLPEDTVKLAGELAELIAKNRKTQKITTPQLNDEELLYKLNAQVRLESRKYVDPDNCIKQIISQFKSENPQLIEKLRVERSRNNFINCNRTDSSANCLSAANSKEQSTEISSKQTPVQISKEPIWVDREHVSIPNFRPIIFNSSIEDSDNNIVKNMEYNQSPKMRYLPPVAVYSASDDENESPLNKVSENYAWVKSSTELLTTLLNVDNTITNSEAETNEEAIAMNNYTLSPNILDNDYNNNSTVTKVEEDINKNGIETMEVENNSNDSSDLAEALTQIIEEYSVDANATGSDENTFLDDELVRETIQEIQDEIQSGVSVDNIVLTPPLQFRD